MELQTGPEQRCALCYLRLCGGAHDSHAFQNNSLPAIFFVPINVSCKADKRTQSFSISMVSLPDAISAIAGYCPTNAHPVRLPLAFIATHPSARIVTELREAERSIFFQFLPREENGSSTATPVGEALRRQHRESALLLATATTPLFRFDELLQQPSPRTVTGSNRDVSDARSAGGQRSSSLRASVKKLAGVISRIQLADVYKSDGGGGSSDSSSSSDSGSAGEEAPVRSKRVRGSRKSSVISSLACCGTSIGGLTTILVSRSELVSKTPALLVPKSRCGNAALSVAERKTVDHSLGSGITLQQWFESHEKGKHGEASGTSYHLQERLPKNADRVPYLFSPTTVSPAVISLPEAMHYHEKQPGITGTSALGVDDHRHKLKTAMSTAIAHDFLSAAEDDAGGDEVFRLLLITDADAIPNVLLSVSQWWLHRPVAAAELPSRAKRGNRKASTASTAAQTKCPPLRIKLATDVFDAPSLLEAWVCYAALQCALYLYELATVALGFGATAWPYPSFLPKLLPTASDRQRLERLRRSRESRREAPTNVHHPFADALLSVLLGVLFLPLGVFAGVLLMAWECFFPPGIEATAAPECESNGSACRVPVSALLRHMRLTLNDPSSRALVWMERLGDTFSGGPEGRAPLLQGLDASRTTITGTHLLALTHRKTPSPGFLCSLDLSGCPKLHCSDTAGRRLRPRHGDEVVDALCPSDLGLALGKLTYHGSLQWLTAAGSTFDSAAVASLGAYSLLHEALAMDPSHKHENSVCLSPSLLAVNVTSCRHLGTLSGFAHVSSLVQLLVPFSDLTDAGLNGLDGHNFPLQLCEMVERMGKGREMQQRERSESLASKPNAGDSSAAHMAAFLTLLSQIAQVKDSETADAHARATVRALARRFTSHIYHLDLTFSNALENINGVLHTQRVLQFLSIGETSVSGAGLGADVRHANHEVSFDTAFLCPLHKITSLGERDTLEGCYRAAASFTQPWPSPLRVLIADPCDHVDSLRGLTPSLFPSLEKLYVRSAGLSEEGLAAIFADWREPHTDSAKGRPPHSAVTSPRIPFSKLQLIDLNYCDKIHDVGILSRFPALHTLNLDNTEVTPAGLESLHSPTGSLKVLSLRYCPEIMAVLRKASNGAERLKLFRSKICNLPSLETVIVEDEWRAPVKPAARK